MLPDTGKRRGFVADTAVVDVREGNPLFSRLKDRDESLRNCEVIWAALLHVRRGAKPLSRNIAAFSTREEADQFCRDILETEIEHDREKFFLSRLSSKAFDRMLAEGLLGADQMDHVDFGIGPPIDQVVLEAAGVYLPLRGPMDFDAAANDWLSPKVVHSLGVSRKVGLKKAFGAQWSVVAAFEYCWRNFPHSSPAYLAAAYHYHLQISRNLLLAGYLLRDLEIVWENIEEDAQKGARVVAAAKAGGAARAAKAAGDRAAVIEHMSELVIGKGMTPAKASQILHRQGIGTSESNNRQIWYRHKPVTLPGTVTD